jgi:hypothetical protein
MSQLPADSNPDRGEGATYGPPSSVRAVPSLKLRSCVTCRQRRVRCDKESPCSNCRRAGIACVVPSSDRPPRWARRLEALAKNTAASHSPAVGDTDLGNAGAVERIRHLENLVKELRGQLEQTHEAAHSSNATLSGVNLSGSFPQHLGAEHDTETPLAAKTNSVQKQFGRLVLQNASHSRYISSGFWSEVSDEVSPPLAVIHPSCGMAQ